MVVATEALLVLMAPDGYYKYLDVPKPLPVLDPKHTPAEGGSGSGSGDESNPLIQSGLSPIDSDLVRRQYRKLALRHHPDRPGGDAATFRLLNRAQKVLLDPRLRRQYDMLGIDLDDEEEATDNGGDDGEGMSSSSSPDGNKGKPNHPPSSAQGIIQEVASAILTAIMQFAVRTVMMGAVSIVVSQYRITFYPALAFMAFIAFRIFQRTREPSSSSGGGSTLDVLSPVLISAGLWAMHSGRKLSIDYRAHPPLGASSVSSSAHSSATTWRFWLGEALVIGVFTYNSATLLPKTPLVVSGIALFAGIAALWLQGSWWRYAIAVGMQVAVALVLGIAFPVVEMFLDAILNEKLKKVGDRVRAHHEVVEEYYRTKLNR